MVLDNNLLDKLTEAAMNSPKLRCNYDLRNNASDLSQRMLNAVEPGTVMPIHRHPSTSTTVILIKGAIRQNFYDNSGNITESVVVNADSDVRAVQIEQGRWHNLESLKPGTVLFEAKDGPWEPYELLNL